MKLFITESGTKVLNSKWRFLTNYRCYLSTRDVLYQDYNSDPGVGLTYDLPIELLEYLGKYYLKIILTTDHFRASYKSIFIGATDVVTSEVFDDLILIDKMNGFIKTGNESVSWVLDSLIKPGVNVIELGMFNFNSITNGYVNKLPDAIKSDEQIKTLITYENNYGYPDNIIEF